MLTAWWNNIKFIGILKSLQLRYTKTGLDKIDHYFAPETVIILRFRHRRPPVIKG